MKKRISKKNLNKISGLGNLKNIKEITDKQWEKIIQVLPPNSGIGRPRADDRKTINGILWVLSRNSKWSDIPKRYGSPSTCQSRFMLWERNGVWKSIIKTLYH